MDDDAAAVLFDLDDTLCEYRRPTADLLAEAFERTGVEQFVSAAEFADVVPTVSANSPLALREECFRRIAQRKGRSPAVAERVAANYPERDPTAVDLLPDAQAVLRALSERYRLGVVSNGAAPTQRAKLEALDLEPYFETTVFATPATAVKPDPRPFERALADLGVPPERAVHVGDSLAADVAGAQAAGVPAVWFDRGDGVAEDVVPEYTVEELAALEQAPLPWTDS